MEPTHTANMKYDYYSTLYDGKTLYDLVQDLHKYNCEYNKWDFHSLNPGCYGFDTLAVCIGFVFENLPNFLYKDLDEIADVVHKAWAVNYIYWRDNEPYLNQTFNYRKPFKPLADERRNYCARTNYIDLPEDEKEKDMVVVRWLIKVFYKE
jgi:hypothetical protein